MSCVGVTGPNVLLCEAPSQYTVVLHCAGDSGTMARLFVTYNHRSFFKTGFSRCLPASQKSRVCSLNSWMAF
jgi:hypothetical protein